MKRDWLLGYAFIFANKMHFGVHFGSIWIMRANQSQANKIFLKLLESIR